MREKRIKRWLSAWKFALVEKDNPRWVDLYGGFGPGDPVRRRRPGLKSEYANRPGSSLRCAQDDKPSLLSAPYSDLAISTFMISFVPP